MEIHIICVVNYKHRGPKEPRQRTFIINVKSLLEKTLRSKDIRELDIVFEVESRGEISRESLSGNIYCIGQTYAYFRDKSLG